MKKNALGRGLGALIELDNVQTGGGSSINEIDLDLIEANPNQPRRHFDQEALEELSASIAQIGVVQPITLREADGGKYQIIAGERRFRAAKMAGLEKIPAYVKTVDDESVMEMALVENIQREDLNAIEIALSYQRLIDEYKFTQEALSAKVGKKRATIANYLRLLKLPAEVQLGIKNKQIGRKTVIRSAKWRKWYIPPLTAEILQNPNKTRKTKIKMPTSNLCAANCPKCWGRK